MAIQAHSSDQSVENAALAEIPDRGGDSACWAHLVCPECGAISSEGHREGCEAEPAGLRDESVAADQRPVRAHDGDAVSNERASVLAEQRLMRRIVIWTAIAVPVGAAFFALLVLVAARLADVPVGAPVAAGAVVGVLAGLFAGMWVGVVVSVEETEHANLVLRKRQDA